MLRILIILAVINLQGCAYTVVSTASLATTGRSITDHALTQAIPYSDCSSLNALSGRYYCEIQDPGVTYNRHGF